MMRIIYVLFSGFLLGLGWQSAAAEEAILRFASTIQIQKTGQLEITETLRVRVEGKQIKSGIVRQIDRSSGYGGMRLDVHSVTGRIDGNTAFVRTKQTHSHIDILVGDPDTVLTHGDHVFQIRYTVDWALEHTDMRDLLRWNVTGTDSAFPVDSVSVTLTLPDGASFATISAAAGKPGSTKSDGIHTEAQARTATLLMEARLDASEGLTLSADWPAGHIVRPDLVALRLKRLKDHQILVIGVGGAAILLVFYMMLWTGVFARRVDGPARTTPPEQLSAAMCSVIYYRTYTSRAFAGALVSLAAKGALEISETDGVLTVTQATAQPPGDASPGEAVLFTSLFADSETISLSPDNRKHLMQVTKAHQRVLRADEARYFAVRRPASLIGLGFAGIVGLAMVYAPLSWMLSAGLLGIMALTAYLAYRALQRRRSGLHSRWLWQSIFGLLAINVAGLAVFGAPIYGDLQAYIFPAMLLLLLVGLGFVVKSHTPYGEDIAGEIRAFRRYLQNRDTVNPEETSCSDLNCAFRFERLLAYAVALNTETDWNTRFAESLRTAAKDRGQTWYQPYWYHCGSLGSVCTSRIGSTLGATLASAHAQAIGTSHDAASSVASGAGVSVSAGGGVSGF